MVRHTGVLLVVVLGLSAGGPSVASPSAAETISMQALLNDDGSGRLFVNTGTGEPWTWEACSPDLTSCSPFGTGREISTASANPETVFRVSGNPAADLMPGVSPVWHGNVASTRTPSVSGIVRANELVTPIPGTWIGGWGNEPDVMQLSACSEPTGQNCVTLTNAHYVGGCPNKGAVLDPAFAGDYLRVADRRDGSGPHFMLAYGVISPYGLDLWTPGARLSTAVAGRIASATAPPAADCGPPPLNSASISREGIAKVKCGLGCRVLFVAKGKRKSTRLVRKLPRKPAAPVRLGERPLPLRDPISLQLPRWFSSAAGHERIRMIIKIDGKLAARRTVRLPA